MTARKRPYGIGSAGRAFAASVARLSAAIEFAERYPLLRCEHGHALRDDLLTVARSEDTGARWIGDIAQRGAAELDRLRADNARLTATLQEVAKWYEHSSDLDVPEFVRHTRRVLRETPSP